MLVVCGNLCELVQLVDEEMDAQASEYKERLDTVVRQDDETSLAWLFLGISQHSNITIYQDLFNAHKLPP